MNAKAKGNRNEQGQAGLKHEDPPAVPVLTLALLSRRCRWIFRFYIWIFKFRT